MRRAEAVWKYGETICFKKRWFSDFCAECVAFERCSARAWLKFTLKAPELAQRKPDFLRRARASFRKQRPVREQLRHRQPWKRSRKKEKKTPSGMRNRGRAHRDRFGKYEEDCHQHNVEGGGCIG